MQIRQHVGQAKPAAVMYPSGTVVTFDELEARANRLAHMFRGAGLREGDAVAILMENNEHYHAVMWAARRCGLYYVPVNTHLTAAEAPTSSATVTPEPSSARPHSARRARASANICPTGSPSC